MRRGLGLLEHGVHRAVEPGDDRGRCLGRRDERVPGVGGEAVDAGLVQGRHLGHGRDTFGARHREHLHRAGLVLLAHRVELHEQQIEVSGDEVVHHLRGAAIGHVGEAGAGQPREQLAGEVRRGADPLRAEGDLARVGLGVGDELGHARRRKVRPHRDRVRDRCHDREWRERRRVIAELLVQQHARRQRRGLRGEERVSVGLGEGDRFGADAAAGARAVLHHERLAHDLGEAIGEHAGDDVGAAAGRRRHDDPHQAARIAVAGVLRGRAPARRQRACGQDQSDCDDARDFPHETIPALTNHAHPGYAAHNQMSRRDRSPDGAKRNPGST